MKVQLGTGTGKHLMTLNFELKGKLIALVLMKNWQGFIKIHLGRIICTYLMPAI